MSEPFSSKANFKLPKFVSWNTFAKNLLLTGLSKSLWNTSNNWRRISGCSYRFLLSRTGSLYGSGNQRFTQQTDHRKSVLTAGTGYSRLLQLYVRHPQKEWRCSTDFQSETIEPILGRSSFQNRDNQSSSSEDQIKRLPIFHRSVRRFFTRSVTPTFETVLTPEMEEEPSLSVL